MRVPVYETRIDLEAATRDELVAEIQRLNMVCQRWAQSWHKIVEANTAAWIEMVNTQEARIKMLEGLI
jgi:hypothetical protein